MNLVQPTDADDGWMPSTEGTGIRIEERSIHLIDDDMAPLLLCDDCNPLLLFDRQANSTGIVQVGQKYHRC